MSSVKIHVDIETYEKLKDKNTNLVVFETDEKIPSVFIHINNKEEENK